MIPLVKDTIDKDDIDKLIEWLRTSPRLTKGKLTEQYESKWAEFLGSKYAVCVNSGSSANLLMLYSLIASGHLSKGDSVVVPAVSWATDLAPVVQLGLEPILCDCNMEDLSVDLDRLEDILSNSRAKVLMLVSVLGLVPNMENVIELCDNHDVILLEDSCESLGSEFKGKKLGTFGLMSSFSMYFGHHMSTIEGGMVCTDDKDMYNMLKCLRSHGWDRDLDEDYRDALRKNHPSSDFENLYRFYYYGFNFRPTDLQAFIGIQQLKKIDSVIKARHKNYLLYCDLFSNFIWEPQKQREGIYISNFAYPVIHTNREKIVAELTKEGIAVRPLICGSLELQPFWPENREVPKHKNAHLVNGSGFYVPNNHQITEQEIRKVCSVMNKFT
tara:strand:- start:80 stop:1234 length:1155 start_codon:yes stop_codon:yes gene_type:complete